MVNENLAECVCLLDKSGSMLPLVKDVLGGYNNLLREQKGLPGEANLSLVLFDTEIKTLYENMPLQQVPEMVDADYRPSGCTALLDAVGGTITSIGKRLAAMPEPARPGKVILVIMTDGEENSSKRFSKPQVKAMIETQQTAYKWDIKFIGAGIDAFSEAGSIGISKAQTMCVDHSSEGMGATFRGISKSYSVARGIR